MDYNPNYYDNFCECEPLWCDTGDPCDSNSAAFNPVTCAANNYFDCNGDLEGYAYDSSCGCIGGNTGIDECPEDETPTEPVNTMQTCCGMVYINIGWCSVFRLSAYNGKCDC